MSVAARRRRRAAAGGFLPTNVQGLELWLPADSLFLADGASVATWSDQSGKGNDASQATGGNQPTFQIGVLNGKPVVRFDGVDDEMATQNILSASEWSVFIVPGNTTEDGTARVLSTSGVSFSGIGPFGGSGTWGAFSIDGGVKSFGGNVTIFDSILTIIRQSDLLGTGYRNGTQVWTGDPEDSVSSSIITIGSASGANFGDGDIAELLIYSRALSDSERQRVERYLSSKYAIVLA